MANRVGNVDRNSTVANTIRTAKAKLAVVGEPSSFGLQTSYEADTWGEVWNAVWNAAQATTPAGEAPDGTIVPRLTNREAVAVVQAWRAVAPMASQDWKLWYQFMAVAYGWTPTNDTLNVSTQQAGELFPLAMSHELWVSLYNVARDLEATPRAAAVKPASVELDPDAYFDLLVQGDLRTALIADGAKARVASPTPATTTPAPKQKTPAKKSSPSLFPLLLIGGAILAFRKQRRKPTRRRTLVGARRRRK